MKIYQIYERCGEYDTFYDHVVSSYMSKERATAEMERLEKEEAEAIKCNSCPLFYCPQDCHFDCLAEECMEFAIKSVKNNCKKYESDDNVRCKNFHYKEESFFRIEEVEVIE